MQQLELAQMEHRDANLAALAALGPRKRKPLEAPGSGANQVPAHVYTVTSVQSFPVYSLNTSYCADVQEMFTCVFKINHIYKQSVIQSIWSFLYFCLYLDKLFLFFIKCMCKSSCVTVKLRIGSHVT